MRKLYLNLRQFALIILDKLTKKNGIGITVNDLKLKVPGRFYKYFVPDYESDNFSFFRKMSKPGMVCMDIGSHIGIYSVYMARFCEATVFSFEPSPVTMKILKQIIALNHCEKKIKPLAVAIAQHSGMQDFYLKRHAKRQTETIRVAEANALQSRDLGSTIITETMQVATISIDDFTEQNRTRIDFIKIDAEGSELEILRGARRTFLKDKPSGILGIHTFFSADKKQRLLEIWQTMDEYDCRLLFQNENISLDQLLNMCEMELFDLQFLPKL
jgi:FkbM family methyltransferase